MFNLKYYYFYFNYFKYSIKINNFFNNSLSFNIFNNNILKQLYSYCSFDFLNKLDHKFKYVLGKNLFLSRENGLNLPTLNQNILFLNKVYNGNLNKNIYIINQDNQNLKDLDDSFIILNNYFFEKSSYLDIYNKHCELLNLINFIFFIFLNRVINFYKFFFIVFLKNINNRFI